MLLLWGSSSLFNGDSRRFWKREPKLLFSFNASKHLSNITQILFTCLELPPVVAHFCNSTFASKFAFCHGQNSVAILLFNKKILTRTTFDSRWGKLHKKTIRNYRDDWFFCALKLIFFVPLEIRCVVLFTAFCIIHNLHSYSSFILLLSPLKVAQFLLRSNFKHIIVMHSCPISLHREEFKKQHKLGLGLPLEEKYLRLMCLCNIYFIYKYADLSNEWSGSMHLQAISGTWVNWACEQQTIPHTVQS